MTGPARRPWRTVSAKGTSDHRPRNRGPDPGCTRPGPRACRESQAYGRKQMPAWPLTPSHTSEPNRLVLAIHRPVLVISMSSAFALDELYSGVPPEVSTVPLLGFSPCRPG